MSYRLQKVAHLKRVGLVGNGDGAGFGQNGGACPDWLRAEQKAEQKRLAAAAERALRRSFLAFSMDDA